MRVSRHAPIGLESHAKALNFSYPFIGATREKFPAGYNHDRNEVLLGEGEALWAAAKNTLQLWHHYPPTWTKVFKENGQRIEGDQQDTVAVYFKLFGLWWKNHCRMVYVIDKADEWGFAYGTLTDHVEKGEEYFYLRKDQQGKIYYGIQAFSRPNFWLAWLGYPLARFFQRRFVKESLQLMKKMALDYEK